MQRPNLPAPIFLAVTETLATWLARGWPSVAGQVCAWGDDHWSAAEWTAFWQGAIPLWVQRLSESDVAIPSERQARLDEVDAQSRARTNRMLTDVQEMIVGLRALGVEIAPLKGARIAPFYYQPPSLRPLGDIDLLIRPGDLTPARRWLESRGGAFYSRSEEDVVYLLGTRRPEVWHPDNVRPVELHFRLREEFGSAGLTWDFSEDAWSESEIGPFLQTEARLVSPVVLMRHQCAHTSSDLFIQRGKIQQLEDIAVIARSFTSPDWDHFIAGIPRRCARYVYPALALASRYYSDIVPATVLDSLRSSVMPRLRVWVDRLSLSEASESSPESRSGIGVPLALLLAENGAETAGALLASLLPPRWNLMKRYPRLAASPYYPLCYLLLNADRALQTSRRILRAKTAQ